MPNWDISVNAGGNFSSLADNLGGNDLHLSWDSSSETGMVFSAYSPHVNALTEVSAVARRIFSLGVILNGAIRIHLGNTRSHPITFTEFTGQQTGFRPVIADFFEDYPFDTTANVDQNITSFRDPTRHGVSHLIFLAKTHEPIRILLIQAGLIYSHDIPSRILAWSTLYKILDTVKHFSRKHNWDMNSFASPADLNKFTAACNNMSVLGIYARHGSTPNSRPNQVITNVDEASQLILGAAKKFCKKFISERC